MMIEARKNLVQRLLALQKASESIAAANPNSIAQTAADQLVLGYGAALVRIWRTDPDYRETNRLHLWATGQDLAIARDLRRGLPEVVTSPFGRAARVASERSAKVMGRLTEAPAPHDPTEGPQADLVAYAGFPLLAGSDLLGVLELYLTTPLEADEIESLAGFARQVAFALAHTRTSQAQMNLAAEASVTLKLSSLLEANCDLSTVLQTTADYLGQLFKVDATLAQLWALNELAPSTKLNNWLPVANCWYQNEIGHSLLRAIAAQANSRGPTGIAREVLTGSTAVSIDNTGLSPHRLIRDLSARHELRSLSIIPILSREAVIGAVELFKCAEKRPWSAHEIAEAQRIGSVLSLAGQIVGLRLTTQNALILSRIFEIGATAGRLDELTAGVIAEAQQRFSSDLVGLRFSPYGDNWEDWAAQGAAGSLNLQLTLINRGGAGQEVGIDLSTVPDLVQALTNCVPYVINDTTSQPATNSLAEQGVRAALFLPLAFQERTFALLTLAQNRPRRWRRADVFESLIITENAGVALKQARESIVGRADNRLTSFKDHLNRLYGQLVVAEVLEELVKAARAIFEADQASIFAMEEQLIFLAEDRGDAFPGLAETAPVMPQSWDFKAELPSGAPIALNDLAGIDGSELAQALKRSGVRSALVVRLELESANLLLTVQSYRPRPDWRPEEIQLFAELTRHGMTALTAAQSLEQAAFPEQLDQEGDISTGLDANATAIIDRLTQSNRDLEEILDIASHDLRSPLISITGYLHNLERELKGETGARAATSIERIRANTDQMNKLIKGLLDVARLRSPANKAEAVDTRALVTSLQQELRPRLEQAGGAIVIESGLPVVTGSRIRLMQVFSNLFNNAINYRDPSRALKIEVGSRPRGTEVEFYVRDNGIGIASDDHDRIFQPLARLEVNEAEGTGLGLYIVKRNINSHGGRVWVESQEGIGSAFRFTLPAQFGAPSHFRRASPRKRK